MWECAFKCKFIWFCWYFLPLSLLGTVAEPSGISSGLHGNPVQTRQQNGVAGDRVGDHILNWMQPEKQQSPARALPLVAFWMSSQRRTGGKAILSCQSLAWDLEMKIISVVLCWHTDSKGGTTWSMGFPGTKHLAHHPSRVSLSKGVLHFKRQTENWNSMEYLTLALKFSHWFLYRSGLHQRCFIGLLITWGFRQGNFLRYYQC